MQRRLIRGSVRRPPQLAVLLTTFYAVTFIGIAAEPVSTEGGGQPKWRADGRELFYFAFDGTMMSASLQPDGELGPARALFRLPLPPNAYLDEYTMTPDGQRFLIITPVRSDRTARMSVISDWPGLVRQ